MYNHNFGNEVINISQIMEILSPKILELALLATDPAFLAVNPSFASWRKLNRK